MSTNSNYPIGADNDPNAPWNKDERTFCVECQSHEICDHIDEHIEKLISTQELGSKDSFSDYEYNALFDKIYESLRAELVITTCPKCYFEGIDHFDD